MVYLTVKSWITTIKRFKRENKKESKTKKKCKST